MTTATDLVPAAREQVEAQAPGRFAAEAARPDTVAAVVREADERLTGSITGAVHVPRGTLELRADPTSPRHDARLDPGGASCRTGSSGVAHATYH
ncbi:MAG: hypothetical protein ACRD08_04135, partial [Acidimicrobiales bacterium]